MKLQTIIWIGLYCAAFLCRKCEGTAQTQRNQQKNAKHMTDDISGIYQYYGLHQPYFEDGVNHVFAKYDVVAVRVAFCVVDDSLRRAVELNNDNLFKMLSKTFPGLTEDRIGAEVQQSSKTAATLNTIIRSRLKHKIKQLDPHHYIYIKWREDAIEGLFLVDVFVNLYETNQRDVLLWHLKITPATDDVLIKDANGKWNEIRK